MSLWCMNLVSESGKFQHSLLMFLVQWLWSSTTLHLNLVSPLDAPNFSSLIHDLKFLCWFLYGFILWDLYWCFWLHSLGMLPYFVVSSLRLNYNLSGFTLLEYCHILWLAPLDWITTFCKCYNSSYIRFLFSQMFLMLIFAFVLEFLPVNVILFILLICVFTSCSLFPIFVFCACWAWFDFAHNRFFPMSCFVSFCTCIRFVPMSYLSCHHFVPMPLFVSFCTCNHFVLMSYLSYHRFVPMPLFVSFCTCNHFVLMSCLVIVLFRCLFLLSLT